MRQNEAHSGKEEHTSGDDTRQDMSSARKCGSRRQDPEYREIARKLEDHHFWESNGSPDVDRDNPTGFVAGVGQFAEVVLRRFSRIVSHCPALPTIGSDVTTPHNSDMSTVARIRTWST